MFGLTFEKFLLLGVLAAFLLGPQRLPLYASRLALMVKRLKVFVDGAQDRVKSELGDDADLIDWRKLDPRQYDPRRIIREALTDDPPGKGTTVAAPPIVPIKEPIVAAVEQPDGAQLSRGTDA